MGFLNFFNKKHSDKGIGEFVGELNKSAIQLIETDNAKFSKIGGIPEVSAHFNWPQWNGKSLSFIAQIDFSEIENDTIEDLPKQGILYVFYNQDQDTWGFDPKDRGSWKVIFHSRKETIKVAEKPRDIALYTEKRIRFKTVNTYPSWENDDIDAMNLSDAQLEELDSFRYKQFEGKMIHQLFGWADPIQSSNMHEECQLASNGIYCGDAKQYENPKSQELLKDSKEWILLLQVDSDDDCAMMWGDVGKLYFWIKKEDLQSLKFDNVWMILQCG